MNNSLLKNLLPGLIPLFIFIIAEEIWGLEIGLIVAVGFGISELIFTYYKTKKLEKFILVDTTLLVLLGGISYIFNSDVFFKLKPAFIEGILAVILAISAFSPKNLVLVMSKRYMKGMNFNQAAEQQMSKNLKILFYITLIHIALVIYSVYYLSDEAWAFISGGLFYLIFLGYFGFEFVKNKFKLSKYRNEEWFPIVNINGEILDRKPRSYVHNGKNRLLHPVVHLHVFNKSNRLFLQKRPMNKDIQPGKWDTSIGGHVAFGEDIETALQREAEEEIGLKNFKPKFIKKYIWESEIEKELVFIFVTQIDEKPSINKKEVDDGQYWKLKDIKDNLGKGIFTPNFEHEFEIIEKETDFL